MPFVTICGVAGKVYVPEKTGSTPCKHPCPDCFSCQYCSSDRCNICRRSSAEADPCGQRKKAIAKTGSSPAVPQARK